jgi:hypothetical protein
MILPSKPKSSYYSYSFGTVKYTVLIHSIPTPSKSNPSLAPGPLTKTVTSNISQGIQKLPITMLWSLPCEAIVLVEKLSYEQKCFILNMVKYNPYI